MNDQISELEKPITRKVHLVGQSSAPFSFYANPLNKLLITIFCNSKYGYITYHSNIDEFGKYLVPPVTQKNRFLKAIANQVRNVRISFLMLWYNKLTRTGPKAVVYSLFEKLADNKVDINNKTNMLRQLNIGNKQYWKSIPDFFNKDGFNIDEECLDIAGYYDDYNFSPDDGALIL